MSLLNDLMREQGRDILTAALRDKDALAYQATETAEKLFYDASLGSISTGEELEQVGGMVSGKVTVQRRKAVVTPKRDPDEIVDTGTVTIGDKQWAIDRIVGATYASITLDLKRVLDRENPRIRK